MGGVEGDGSAGRDAGRRQSRQDGWRWGGETAACDVQRGAARTWRARGGPAEARVLRALDGGGGASVAAEALEHPSRRLAACPRLDHRPCGARGGWGWGREAVGGYERLPDIHAREVL